MNCDICAESNVNVDHEITEKHIKNKILYEYALNRKQFGGNRKGVLVSCNVQSSFLELQNYVNAKIKISVKPDETITFNFVVHNESRKSDIVVKFIQLAHNKLNFKMNDHGLDIGSEPVTLKPKETLNKKVFVLFKSSDIGQYLMPIIFSFEKPDTEEIIFIMRDMVVYVEEDQRVHDKMKSPYREKEVRADKLYSASVAKKSDDMFRIPKNYKSIYANSLKVREDATKEEKQLCESVKDIIKTGVTEENYAQLFHNLLWYEETIVRINLKKYNMSDVPLYKLGNFYTLYVPGLAEKRPSLMLGDLIFVKPHNNDLVMFEAIINAFNSENEVCLKGLDPMFEKYYRENATFDVRFFMSRLPLERMHRAIDRIPYTPAHLQRVFPVPNPKIPTIKPITNFYNPVVASNPEQALAVAHILGGSAGPAPYLLHGPPGTGKTVTIVEAILQLVKKNSSNRIMVCTESNMAADHVATMLIKYAHQFSEKNLLLRANSEFRVWETLPQCLWEYSNGQDRGSFYPVNIEVFTSYRIVVTTLSHAAKFAKRIQSKRMKGPISHLFIDEAAQASEPSSLIPIAGLLAHTGHLVLAGDPHQLGPVVISHGARRLGLGMSLMERLMKTCPLYNASNDCNYTLMLRNNFRSDPDILHIPNEAFYQGQLRAQAKEDGLSKVDILGERDQSRAVVFHGVLSKEQRMGKSPSFFNDMEVEIVQMYICLLTTRHNVAPEDIGVVTPYIRQVYKIKTWVAKQNFSGAIEVGTVEAFQGKEKRVIIISTVRANCNLLDHDAKFQLGFLVDDKRFNVALTRAKAKAIIIGNPLCLERDAKWRAYMNLCRHFGTFFGYDPLTENTEETRSDIVKRITPILKGLKIKNPKA